METADMLTNLIQDFLNKNIAELKEKNILLTLPNKRIIKLGEHQESIEIVFNLYVSGKSCHVRLSG